MTESIRLSTHRYEAAPAARVGASKPSADVRGLVSLWRSLRAAVRRLNRPRLYRVDQLPPELLRDVDPALHDAISARFNGWYSLDARNRPPFY